MSIVLFEDDRLTQLYPVTTGKAAFTINCGSFRLVDLVATLDRPLHYRVRPHLRGVLEGQAPQGAVSASARQPAVMLNARLVPSMAVLERVQSIIAAGKPGIVKTGAGVALALLPPTAPPLPDEAGPAEIVSYLSLLQLPALEAELPLLEYPHDIIKHHLATLGANLEHRLGHGQYEHTADGVFLAPGARLGDYTVTDTSKGPIILEAGASVGPHCYLSGPAHLGPGARVIEHSAIKDAVSLGHTTKVGGEVEASIIEPYTNKQHHGFLGHSYLGSWVNLGAGTCNSDLKNTYGQVNMEYFGQKVASGMQFLGCMVGDYSKTAINTGIFTGKTIGTCSMVYGFVTTNVPSFVNYARSFGQVTEAPVEVMAAAQSRMFARRNVTQRAADVQLLYDMYELTRHERQIAGEPLSL